MPSRACEPSCGSDCTWSWSGIAHCGDPLMDFFSNLPSLYLHHQKGVLVDWDDGQHAQVHMAAACLLDTCARRPSADNELLQYLRRSNCCTLSARYGLELAMYSIRYRRPESALQQRESCIMTRFLEYYHWVAQGQKDSTAPLPLSIPREDLLLSGTLQRLPVDPDYPWCGLEENGALATEHRNPDVRLLYRAYSMFEAAFEMVLVYLNPEAIHEDSAVFEDAHISEVNGVLKVDHDAESPSTIGLTKDMKRAVLMFMCCEMPVLEAQPLLRMFLRPVCKKIELVQFSPRNVVRPVLEIQDEDARLNTAVAHCVILVELDCGLQFVLDPTAAQYGWAETILPWTTFKKYRMAGDPLEITEVKKNTDPESLHWLDVIEAIALQVSLQIQRKHSGGLTTILEITEQDKFLEQRALILGAMERGMMYFQLEHFNFYVLSESLSRRGAVNHMGTLFMERLYEFYKARQLQGSLAVDSLLQWSAEWTSLIEVWTDPHAPESVKRGSKRQKVRHENRSSDETATG
ncbi:hypothetical protein QBC40DRAFT_249016 [Triangularia verruculosa]|uniref:Uncharacterized protein n=1 Tax=Triangularia verruculosa TaxID=2587418 RepID=A0AAN6XRW6_9PEZI|nr:hypothetical protein QBC40DRAFT_249016 [Triangularia verruculosa]